MIRTSVIVTVLWVGLALAAPAAAEPGVWPVDDGVSIGLPDGQGLDLSLRVDTDGFRVSGRLLDRHGPAAGAWLGGRTRRDGITLDGGVERDGHTHGFTFDTTIEAWTRARRAWGVTDL